MFNFLIFILCPCLALGVPFQEGHNVFNGDIGGRIIGGQEAHAGQFRFLVAINVTKANGRYFCGGALLNHEWILTAGHCVNGATLLVLQLGSNNLNAEGISVIKAATDTYVLHPDFDPDSLENDIGLIKLRQLVFYNDYIRPIDLLPSAPISDGSPLVTMGWGQVDDEISNLQTAVKFVSVTTIPNDECRAVYGNIITDTRACAEGNYNEGTCFGDTGGPLIQYVSRGQVMHVGISSFISGNGCESTDPSGYTRTFNYVKWIKDTTGFS